MKYENQTYIKSVKLSGYKSIKDLEVEFLPGMNIIIGENGSGKTNFLEFLEWGMDGDNLNKLSFYDCSSYVALTDEDNTVHSRTKNAVFVAKYRYPKSADESILPEIPISVISTEEKQYINNQVIYDSVTEYDTNAKKTSTPTNLYNSAPEYDAVKNKFSAIAFVKFGIPEGIPFFDFPETVKIKNYNFDFADSNSQRVNSEKYEITAPFLFVVFSYLSNLKHKGKEEKFNSKLDHLNFIKKELRKVSPIIDFRFSSGINSQFQRIDNLGNGYIDNLFVEFNINDEWFRWNDLSDGTKRIFILIWRISNPSVKQILIEEPEIGVHPKQLGILMTVLKEYAKSKQVILTTHSPDILDVLLIDELDRIFVCKLSNAGTKLHKLDDKRRLKAKAYMTEVDYLSSYWRMSDLENVEV